MTNFIGTAGQVDQLFIHPIKGLTPQAVNEAEARTGGLSGDRAFALIFADKGESPPRYSTPFTLKSFLAVQNDWPALAALSCRYDSATTRLTISDSGTTVLDLVVSRDEDCLLADAFFSAYLARQTPSATARHPQAAPVRLVGSPAGGTRYPDRAAFDVSILNLASLEAVSDAVGVPLDIRRFRGNIILRGLDPWAELKLIGKSVVVGSCELEIKDTIGRCHNINVDPDSGAVHAGVLRAVGKSTGKGSFGVLATVRRPGRLATGNQVTVI